MEEYRDVHNSDDILEGLMKQINNSNMSQRQKESIQRFINDLKIGKSGKKVKSRRVGAYLQSLLRLNEYFKKDIDKLSDKETEKFYQDLQEDKIKRKNNMPYAQASKDELTKALKRYLGWSWGKDSKKYSASVRWMKEDYKKSDKKAITLEQAKEVIDKKKFTESYHKNLKIRDKCLFIFLFDSGARIEEALNVKISDLKTIGKDKQEYFMVHLRGQKTEEADRTIAIPLVTKYLNDWLKVHPTKEENDFLFPINYGNARKIIRVMTKDVLKFVLKPHELRHSSATHYIRNGGFGAENIGGFYYRYGWKFGSKEALTYIKTYLYGGELGQDKVVKAIVSDRIENLENQIEELKKRVEDMQKEREEFRAFANQVKQMTLTMKTEMEKQISKEELEKYRKNQK